MTEIKRYNECLLPIKHEHLSFAPLALNYQSFKVILEITAWPCQLIRRALTSDLEL